MEIPQKVELEFKTKKKQFWIYDAHELLKLN